MARNRKSQSTALRFGPAVAASLLCLLIGGTAVGYVYQKEQIDRLSQQIRNREVRLGELIEENENRKKLLANLRSPACLELRVKELNLGLAQPQPGQVWHLDEPAREMPRLPREQQYAAHAARALNPPRTNEPMNQ